MTEAHPQSQLLLASAHGTRRPSIPLQRFKVIVQGYGEEKKLLLHPWPMAVGPSLGVRTVSVENQEFKAILLYTVTLKSALLRPRLGGWFSSSSSVES